MILINNPATNKRLFRRAWMSFCHSCIDLEQKNNLLINNDLLVMINTH